MSFQEIYRLSPVCSGLMTIAIACPVRHRLLRQLPDLCIRFLLAAYGPGGGATYSGVLLLGFAMKLVMEEPFSSGSILWQSSSSFANLRQPLASHGLLQAGCSTSLVSWTSCTAAEPQVQKLNLADLEGFCLSKKVIGHTA